MHFIIIFAFSITSCAYLYFFNLIFFNFLIIFKRNYYICIFNRHSPELTYCIIINLMYTFIFRDSIINSIVKFISAVFFYRIDISTFRTYSISYSFKKFLFCIFLWLPISFYRIHFYKGFIHLKT